MSFENNNMRDIETYVEECWQKCINLNVHLPIEQIKLNDSEEDYVGKKSFSVEESTEVEQAVEMEVKMVPRASEFDMEVDNIDNENIKSNQK